MIPELSKLDVEDYWVRQVQILVCGEEMRFDLHVTSNLEGEDIDCSYELLVSGVVTYNLSSKEDGDLFEFEKDHPLITAYCEPCSDLFCQVADSDRFTVLPALLRAHKRWAQDWLDPFDYVNGCSADGWSFGKLATGPNSLIAAYSAAVSGFAIKCNALEVGPQKDWDGSVFQERDSEIVGICFGTSYVLCREYVLQKKDSD